MTTDQNNGRGEIGWEMDYTTFGGDKIKVTPFNSKYFALLLPKQTLAALKHTVLDQMNAAFEGAMGHYIWMTNGHPKQSSRNYWGRNVMTATPKVVNGWFAATVNGETGIETSVQNFEAFYSGVAMQRNGLNGLPLKHPEYDIWTFYELARCYNTIEQKLYDQGPAGNTSQSAFETGMAVFLRTSGAYLGAKVIPGPVSGRPYGEFLVEAQNLMVAYSRDPKLSFVDVFVKGIMPAANPMGLGKADVFAAMLSGLMTLRDGDLARQFEFYPRFFDRLRKQPNAKNLADVVANFAIAVSYAAEHNLGAFLGTVWKFPITPQLAQTLQSQFGNPVRADVNAQAEEVSSKTRAFLRQMAAGEAFPQLDFRGKLSEVTVEDPQRA